jgi:C4-dicarboxylate transporter DctM subunit
MFETTVIVSCMILLFILLALRVPFYVAFIACAIPILYFVTRQGSLTIGTLATDSVNGFTLISIPLFILLGNIMSACGATADIFELCRSVVGRIKGGIGMAAIVACAIFGTMCGSAVGTALAVGSIAVPELAKNGYKRETAAAIVGCAGGLGMLIPPSIAFIILGDVLQVSISDLFMAGVVPGLVCMVLLCIACYILVLPKVKSGEIQLDRIYSWAERRKAFVKVAPIITVPAAVIGSLWVGLCTPTEAAGVSCFVAILLARFYYKKFGLKEIKQTVTSTAKSSAAIFCIVIGSVMFGRVLAIMFIPQSIGAFAGTLGLESHLFQLAVFTVFGFLGMIFDAFVLWLIALPPLVPALELYSIDLVSFGVLFQLIVMLGSITPPSGIVLYAAATSCDAPIWGTIKESVLFMVAVAITVVIMIFVPGLALY